MTRLNNLIILAGFVLINGASSSEAAIIDTLFNTGVDANGQVLTPGSQDPHWVVTAEPSSDFTVPDNAIVQSANSAWIANDAVGTLGSSWIGIVSSGSNNVTEGDYTAQLSFDLTGYIANTAVLSLDTASDNGIEGIRLNGTSFSEIEGGFKLFTAQSDISTGFVEGLNVLEIDWRNTGANPSGLRVEVFGTAALIPEPSALVVLALACVGFLTIRRRRA